MFVGFLVDFLVRRLVGYAAFSRFPDLRHAALGQQTFQKNKPINKLSKKWKTSQSTINTAAHANYIAQKMIQNLKSTICDICWVLMGLSAFYSNHDIFKLHMPHLCVLNIAMHIIIMTMTSGVIYTGIFQREKFD